MDFTLLAFPAIFIVAGIGVMIFMSKRGQASAGVAQDRMREYAIQEYPELEGTSFSVIDLMEDALNAQHIWVIAYDKGGMRFIPTISNPLTQTLKKYEEVVTLNWKKMIAMNLFVGNKTGENEYVPFSAVTEVRVDRGTKKVMIRIGDAKKSFKYLEKDCFGAPQETQLEEFFGYLGA